MIFFLMTSMMIFVLVFACVNREVMDRNSYNMRLDDNRVRHFNRKMNWVGNFNLLDDRNFDFLVNRELFNVMMMNGVDFVGDVNVDAFVTVIIVTASNNS